MKRLPFTWLYKLQAAGNEELFIFWVARRTSECCNCSKPTCSCQIEKELSGRIRGVIGPCL
eukprot:6328444-Amphidinium_carterae.1